MLIPLPPAGIFAPDGAAAGFASAAAGAFSRRCFCRSRFRDWSGGFGFGRRGSAALGLIRTRGGQDFLDRHFLGHSRQPDPVGGDSITLVAATTYDQQFQSAATL